MADTSRMGLKRRRSEISQYKSVESIEKIATQSVPAQQRTLRMQNNTKAKLTRGDFAFGISFMEFNSPVWAQVFANCGFDFLFIDMEHSTLSIETIGDITWGALGAGISPIIRVPQAERFFISRLLDNGAHGFIVPRVETMEQVEKTVAYGRYSPRGDRSIAGSGRQFNLLPQTDLGKAVEKENEKTLIGIQIETKTGLDRVEELVAHPELDLIFIGPGDLSLSLGIPGQYKHPDFLDAVDRIIAVSRKNGHHVGMQSLNLDYSRNMMARGINFIVCGAGMGIIRKQCAEMVLELKQPLEPEADSQGDLPPDSGKPRSGP